MNLLADLQIAGPDALLAGFGLAALLLGAIGGDKIAGLIRLLSVIALGAAEHEKPNNVGGEIVTATVRDPWGNVVGLIYNPEFKLP